MNDTTYNMKKYDRLKKKKKGSSYIEKLKTISLGLCTFFLDWCLSRINYGRPKGHTRF